VALSPRINVPGSLGVKFMIKETIKMTIKSIGINIKIRLITYLAIVQFSS
jgi:hypothetical protein